MSARRSLAVLVCWTLILGTLTPPAAAGAVVVGSEPAGVGAGVPATGVDSTASGTGSTVPPDGLISTAAGSAVVQANNTTIRHRNPDRRNEDGDLGAIQSHLADRMGEIVVDCSRAVSVGEFDPCERLNGSYDETLSTYVEVSRETRTERDDESAREFRRARREGREYARTVRRFRESYADYREARASGNASRARREARELRTLADEAERTGGNLTRSLGNVTRGGTDVSSASRTVNETTANVSRTVEGIEGALFVETDTTARLGTPVGSFLDPVVVTGRVTTANGTAVADARVGLSLVRDGSVERRVRAGTRTNATGHYRLRFRPVTVPASTLLAAVRLLPAAESQYLPSNATVTPRIEQVDAELTVLSAPTGAAYGDRLSARVRVTAGETVAGGTAIGETAAGEVTVRGLPVTARVGDRRLGSARTGADGEATPGGRFPADIPPGERTLVVGFEATDRAIEPVAGRVEVTVRETGTVLSATVDRTGNRSVAVEGRLATADGRPLAGRGVRVGVAGRSLGTLRSDRNGSVEGNLTVPRAVLPTGGPAERTVRLSFDGAGGNLAPAEATATVRFEPLGGAEPPLDGLVLPVSALAVLLVLAAGGALLVYRRSEEDEGSTAARGTGSTDERGAPAVVDPEAALEAARAAMDAGDYDLVTTAGYRAVRRALAGQVGVGPEATHWEFYGACAADGVDPERLEAVRGLTERFERVAFAPDEASRSVAAASLADVETVLGPADADGDPASGPTDATEPPSADGPADADRS